mmetsp:Transcript_16873/g.21907  ORF Transcript_16873/g.21907 Transcript_16873/m.21907 type:complete len:400 (-) Transcript_16873:55-1254(-)
MSSRPKLEQAKRTRVLHLAMAQLPQVPRIIFSQLQGLLRLDLAYNAIEELPPEIGQLTALEQLWLNHNPLHTLPPELHLCRKLKELDLSYTQVRTVPKEVGRLQFLMKVDLRGTPLKQKMMGFQEDTDGLIAYLEYRDVQRTLKTELEEGLHQGLYREICGTQKGATAIAALVKAVGKEFPLLDELRMVARNRDRLFPPELLKPPTSKMTPQRQAKKIREGFLALRKKNQMKKLSADLELKIRAIYYDQIDVSEVEGYISSIYTKMDTVENVEFIIQYAKQIMPKSPEDITGELILQSMLDFQQKLTIDRQVVVDGLYQALLGVYADREPPQVRELTEAVAKLFQKQRFASAKEVEEMKKLTADASVIFPPEFESAKPEIIRKMFKQKEAMARANMGIS